MDSQCRLQELIAVAEKLAIKIEISDLSDNEFLFESGYCKVRGQSMIILDRWHSEEDQIKIILNTLKRFDLENIFVPEWIRERLENPKIEN